MTDDRDINALRHYVARLEEDLASADLEIERLRKYSSKQALDIVTLGQELGRLREERPQIDYVIDSVGVTHRSFTLVYKTLEDLRAALAEKEEK